MEGAHEGVYVPSGVGRLVAYQVGRMRMGEDDGLDRLTTPFYVFV